MKQNPEQKLMRNQAGPEKTLTGNHYPAVKAHENMFAAGSVSQIMAG